jgi:glycosyltransferase involved in cell wall biosynthesis
LAELERPEEVEVIFVDGYSSDRTVEIIRSYNLGKLFSYPPRGRADAFNRGVENSSGYFVTFLHSDDEYSPGYLAGLLKHAHRYKGQNVVVYTSVKFIDEMGKELYIRKPAPYIGFIQKYQSIIFHPNALYPTHLMREFPFEVLPGDMPSDRQQVYRLMQHARPIRDASLYYCFRISEHSQIVRLGRGQGVKRSIPLQVKLMQFIGRIYIQLYETRLIERLLNFIINGQTPWRPKQ